MKGDSGGHDFPLSGWRKAGTTLFTMFLHRESLRESWEEEEVKTKIVLWASLKLLEDNGYSTWVPPPVWRKGQLVFSLQRGIHVETVFSQLLSGPGRRTDGAVKRSRKQIDPGKEWKLHLVAGAPLCQQESSTSCQAERMHWPAKWHTEFWRIREELESL